MTSQQPRMFSQRNDYFEVAGKALELATPIGIFNIHQLKLPQNAFAKE